MNFIPAGRGRGAATPFGDVRTARRSDGGPGDQEVELIAGIRPGALRRRRPWMRGKGRGLTFNGPVDVIEWLGNEQYAYVPYEAPADIISSAGRARA